MEHTNQPKNTTMSDSDPPRVGVQALEEPAGHYQLVINGKVVSGKVLLSGAELAGLGEDISEHME